MTPSPRGRLYGRLIAAPTANLKVSLLFVGAGPRPARWLTDKFLSAAGGANPYPLCLAALDISP